MTISQFVGEFESLESGLTLKLEKDGVLSSRKRTKVERGTKQDTALLTKSKARVCMMGRVKYRTTSAARPRGIVTKNVPIRYTVVCNRCDSKVKSMCHNKSCPGASAPASLVVAGEDGNEVVESPHLTFEAFNKAHHDP